MDNQIELKVLQNVKVLAVDDAIDDLEAWRAILTHNGAETRVATSVTQALEILSIWYPDILISALSIPGDYGYSLISEVRQKSALKIIPAIAISNVIDKPNTAINLGYSIFIRKPIDPEDLVKTITSLLINS